MRRLSSSEKWLLALAPFIFLIPVGIARSQGFRAPRAPVAVWEHTGRANSVAFSPDSLHLVSSGGELDKGPEVRVWNLLSKEREAEFKGDGGLVMNLDARFSPDGTRVLGIKGDGYANQWSWPEGKPVSVLGQISNRSRRGGMWEPPIFGIGRLMSADYSTDGKTIATCGYLTATNAIWNADTAALKEKFAPDYESFSGVRYSPDGKHFLTVSARAYKEDPDSRGSGSAYNTPENDRAINFWNVSTSKRIGKLPVVKVFYAAWSPDGKSVAIVRETGTVKREFPEGRGQSRVMDVPVTDGEVWDVNFNDGVTMRKTATLRGDGALIDSLDWSPDGKNVVMHTIFEGARIWRRSGEELARLHFKETSNEVGGSSFSRTIAWSPDGKWIAAVNGPHVELWNVAQLQTK